MSIHETRPPNEAASVALLSVWVELRAAGTATSDTT
jgi:hypothetical protein